MLNPGGKLSPRMQKRIPALLCGCASGCRGNVGGFGGSHVAAQVIGQSNPACVCPGFLRWEVEDD